MDLTEIKQLDEQYYMPVFGERLPVAFTRGEGAYLFDTEGKRYADFLAGIAVNALGYSDAGFLAAVREQAALIHTCNYFYNEKQALLARALCQKTGYGKVFFANSGAEANECALKLAKIRAHKKGSPSARFVTLKNSFHGRTLLTLTATGQDKFHTPFAPGAYDYAYIEANDADAAKSAVTKDICAVLIEVIQGEGGVIPLEKDYVRLLRELCDEAGALLIIDEVQTGMGRTGKFLAQEHFGVRADVVTLAKALGNGVPVGACLATAEAASFYAPGDHGSTFGGGHLACAAGLYVTEKIGDALLAEVADKGAYFMRALQSLADSNPRDLQSPRGMGLMLGLPLSAPRSAADVRNTLLGKGFIVGTAGANALRFVPPYCIGKAEIDGLAEAIGQCLA